MKLSLLTTVTTMALASQPSTASRPVPAGGLRKQAHPKHSPSVAPKLFVQMGKKCTLLQGEDQSYDLVIGDMNRETWAFTDRPARGEEALSTHAFLHKSLRAFESDPPNVAVTFVDGNGEQHGPVVVVVTNAGTAIEVKKDSEGRVEAEQLAVSYSLEQSSDQASVVSLQSFFEKGGRHVEFDNCSLFIDRLPLFVDSPPFFGGSRDELH